VEVTLYDSLPLAEFVEGPWPLNRVELVAGGSLDVLLDPGEIA